MNLRRPRMLITFFILALSPITVFANTDRIFDSFGAINCEVEMARLDNLTIELQNTPGTRAYIFVYGGKRGTYRNEVQVRGARMKRYLIESRGIDPDRVRLINGGYRETLSVDVLIIPNDTTAPAASPTVEAKAVRFKRGKMALYSEVGCFPGKYLKTKFHHR
jgi:hypothetical protein